MGGCNCRYKWEGSALSGCCGIWSADGILKAPGSLVLRFRSGSPAPARGSQRIFEKPANLITSTAFVDSASIINTESGVFRSRMGRAFRQEKRFPRKSYMSYNQNSLNGGCVGDYFGDYYRAY